MSGAGDCYDNAMMKSFFTALKTECAIHRFNMLGAIGQFETEIRAERQMDGILKAKARGVHFGRERKLSDEQVIELKRQQKNGDLVKHLMADYDISKATLYRYLSEVHSTTSVGFFGGVCKKLQLGLVLHVC